VKPAPAAVAAVAVLVAVPAEPVLTAAVAAPVCSAGTHDAVCNPESISRMTSHALVLLIIDTPPSPEPSGYGRLTARAQQPRTGPT
jgi:hypothetical protein